MAFSMDTVRAIASRFGVDPGDDAAVTRFLELDLPTLRPGVQRAIESELLAADSHDQAIIERPAHPSSTVEHGRRRQNLNQTGFRPFLNGELCKSIELGPAYPLVLYAIKPHAADGRAASELAEATAAIATEVAMRCFRQYDVLGELDASRIGILTAFITRPDGSRRSDWTTEEDTLAYCAWEVGDRLARKLVEIGREKYPHLQITFTIGFETTVNGEITDYDQLMRHAISAADADRRESETGVSYYRGPLRSTKVRRPTS
jgi:hypothetical protein